MPPNSPPDLVTKAQTRRRQVNRKIALAKYYTSHAGTLRQKARERMRKVRARKEEGESVRRIQADFTYREKQRRRIYTEKYGSKSFRDFYLPLAQFFGSDNLSGVTLLDQTRQKRNASFRLAITEEHEEAKTKFWKGERVKVVITDESLKSLDANEILQVLLGAGVRLNAFNPSGVPSYLRAITLEDLEMPERLWSNSSPGPPPLERSHITSRPAVAMNYTVRGSGAVHTSLDAAVKDFLVAGVAGGTTLFMTEDARAAALVAAGYSPRKAKFLTQYSQEGRGLAK